MSHNLKLAALSAIVMASTQASHAAVQVDVSQSPYSASCGASASHNQSEVQRAFDQNPQAEIVFSGDCNYNLQSELILTDSTHHYGGSSTNTDGGTVRFIGSTSVTFTSAGSPTAADSAMSAGFRMYTQNGGEQGGPLRIRFINPHIVGPENGVGIYMPIVPPSTSKAVRSAALAAPFLATPSSARV